MSDLTETMTKPVAGVPLVVWLIAGGVGVALAVQARRGGDTVTREVQEVPVPVGGIASEDRAPVVMTPVIRINIPEKPTTAPAPPSTSPAPDAAEALRKAQEAAAKNAAEAAAKAAAQKAAAAQAAAAKAAAQKTADAQKAAAAKAAALAAERAAAAKAKAAAVAQEKADLSRVIKQLNAQITDLKKTRANVAKSEAAAKKSKKDTASILGNLAAIDKQIASLRKRRDAAVAQRAKL